MNEEDLVSDEYQIYAKTHEAIKLDHRKGI
jgi:hypothetical protein